MARYIDADSRIAYIKRVYCADCNNYDGIKCKTCPIDDALMVLEEAPDENVAEVKHGVWIAKERTSISKRGRVVHYSNHKCSICGKWNGRHKTNHCPNCGAKMDERKGE